MIALAVAGERELATMREFGAFIDDAANAPRITGGMHAVEDHFGDCFLAFDAFAARLVIHRFGETVLLGENFCQRQIAR